MLIRSHHTESGKHPPVEDLFIQRSVQFAPGEGMARKPQQSARGHDKGIDAAWLRAGHSFLHVEGNLPTATCRTGGDGSARFDPDADLVAVADRMCDAWPEEPSKRCQQQSEREEGPVLCAG